MAPWRGWPDSRGSGSSAVVQPDPVILGYRLRPDSDILLSCFDFCAKFGVSVRETRVSL